MPSASPTDAEDHPVAVEVEWVDATTNLRKPLRLLVHPTDQTLELHDVVHRKVFMKRCQCPPGFHESQLRVGHPIQVYGRQLVVQAYSDDFSRDRLTQQVQRALVVVPVNRQLGQVIADVFESGFQLHRLRSVRTRSLQACLDTIAHLVSAAPNSAEPAGSNASDPLCCLMEVSRFHGEQLWRQWLDDHSAGLEQSPQALFLDTSKDAARVDRAMQRLFESTACYPRTTRRHGTALVLIKPHLLRQTDEPRAVGDLIDGLLAGGVHIEDMQLYQLDRRHANEFYDIYRGVFADVPGMVSELCSGPCLAMEVALDTGSAARTTSSAGKDDEPLATDTNIDPALFQRLETLVGPHQPELARAAVPDTLRARFGVDEIRNAVHCTDLPEDGPLEVYYFFHLLFEEEPSSC